MEDTMVFGLLHFLNVRVVEQDFRTLIQLGILPINRVVVLGLKICVMIAEDIT